MGAGTAGYCTGNLQLEGHTLPHEDKNFAYPRAFLLALLSCLPRGGEHFFMFWGGGDRPLPCPPCLQPTLPPTNSAPYPPCYSHTLPS